MSKVDIVTEKKNEQQLANVFLLLVAIECLVSFEFTANVCEFFIDSLDLCFLAFT